MRTRNDDHGVDLLVHQLLRLPQHRQQGLLAGRGDRGHADHPAQNAIQAIRCIVAREQALPMMV